jgi:hypothetical protein
MSETNNAVHMNLYLSFVWSKSQDRVVGIVTGYGLDDRGVGVGVQVGSRIFLLHVFQTGSRAHPASYPMGTGGSFYGSKAVEA